jgi:regulator of sigma D
MLERKLLNQYCWILKVLNSCQTNEQLDSCHNLFDNFMKQNRDSMSNAHFETFTKVFEVEKKTKSYSFHQKKKSKFTFNSSKFFLF